MKEVKPADSRYRLHHLTFIAPLQILRHYLTLLAPPLYLHPFLNPAKPHRLLLSSKTGSTWPSSLMTTPMGCCLLPHQMVSTGRTTFPFSKLVKLLHLLPFSRIGSTWLLSLIMTSIY